MTSLKRSRSRYRIGYVFMALCMHVFLNYTDIKYFRRLPNIVLDHLKSFETLYFL